jgi:hypothetical protein
MFESDDDVRKLQALLDRTLAHAGVEEIEPIWREIYGSSPFEWGEGVVFMRIEPSSMWAYAFHPENFPE